MKVHVFPTVGSNYAKNLIEHLGSKNIAAERYNPDNLSPDIDGCICILCQESVSVGLLYQFAKLEVPLIFVTWDGKDWRVKLIAKPELDAPEVTDKVFHDALVEVFTDDPKQARQE